MHYITTYIEGENTFAMLYIAIKDNYKPHKKTDNVSNWGYIEIKSIKTSGNINLWYDGIDWFISTSKKEIRKELKKDGLKDDELIRNIKKVIKQHVKHGYLHE